MRAPHLILLGLVSLIGTGSSWARGAEVPRRAEQLIVAVADHWQTIHADLWCLEREGNGWRATRDRPIPVLLGRTGLVWGSGVGQNPRGARKVEGDGKTPAGIFRVGKVYGYASGMPSGSADPRYPYNQVTERDAWVDDPKNRYYNRHLELRPGEKAPPWFESQRMRLGDDAYEWRIEIRHNADPPRAGMGSVIFFHARRGVDLPSAGCTVMEKTDLVRIIRWLRQSAKPHYVILPRAEYQQLQGSWKLPPLP